MQFDRRNFLKTSMMAASGLWVLGGRSLVRSAKASDGFIEIVAKEAAVKLYRDDSPPSALWTFDGTSPGPQIRVKRGERVRVRLINELAQATSIHWHGIRIANAMDGVAGLTQAPIQPGEAFEYDFVAPDAGTYWYHAHNKSWNQVARGLYGALIVEEENPPFDKDHDLTLVADDWRLDRQGVLDLDSLGSLMDWSHGGRLGNWLTLNGKDNPEFNLQTGHAYRLRLINVCNSRILQIDPSRFAAKIIAYDGQSLPKAIVPQNTPIALAPAQRIDLLITSATKNFVIEEVSGKQSHGFARFTIGKTYSPIAAIASLQSNDLREPDISRNTLSGASPDASRDASNVQRIKLHMSGGAMGRGGDIVYNGKKLEGNDFRDTGQLWAFNGVANLTLEPFFKAERGQTVAIQIFNDTAFSHAMHIHGHHFRVLPENGNDEEKAGPWRDTFIVFAAKTKTIAFVADNPGKWLLHCHMLEHAAAGMNTWFEVA